MKTARFVLKIIAASLTLAATVCFIIGYWDKIMEFFDMVSDKINHKKVQFSSEYEDYADWEG